MLNKQDLLDRRIRAAAREYDELSQRRFTVIKLDEAIQRGWRRFFVLSEHAERRKDRDILAAILALIGTEQCCRRPDFRTRGRRSRRIIEAGQSLRRIGDREWEKLQIPSSWLPYFKIHRYSEWGRPAFRAEFAHPSLFEFRVEPFWVWEIREPDPAIETRLEELRRWLELNGGWHRWAWLNGWRRWRCGCHDARAKALNREHRRSIRDAMHGEADPVAPARRIRFSLPRRRNIFPGVAQCRGNEFRPRRVRVRVLPPGPLLLP